MKLNYDKISWYSREGREDTYLYNEREVSTQKRTYLPILTSHYFIYIKRGPVRTDGVPFVLGLRGAEEFAQEERSGWGSSREFQGIV